MRMHAHGRHLGKIVTAVVAAIAWTHLSMSWSLMRSQLGASGPPRHHGISRRAETDTPRVASRSWKKAFQDAVVLERQLHRAIETAQRKVRMLDEIMTNPDSPYVPVVPPPPKRAPRGWRNRSIRGGMRLAVQEAKPLYQEYRSPFRKMLEGTGDHTVIGVESARDYHLQPPVLYWGEKERERIIQDADRNLRLPARVYPAQLEMGAKDDISMSDDENQKWKDALKDISEKLEVSWIEAETAMDSFSAAKKRIADRVPDVVLQFRKRMVKAMECALEGQITKEEMEERLQILLKDKDHILNLANMEETVLEIEGIQNEMAGRELSLLSMEQFTPEYDHEYGMVGMLMERLEKAKFDMRNDIYATQLGDDLADKATDEIEKFFEKLNPFR